MDAKIRRITAITAGEISDPKLALEMLSRKYPKEYGKTAQDYLPDEELRNLTGYIEKLGTEIGDDPEISKLINKVIQYGKITTNVGYLTRSGTLLKLSSCFTCKIKHTTFRLFNF